MPVWKLKPLDLSDHIWNASTVRQPVIVRAADEASARHLAYQTFWIAPEKPPGAPVPTPPWEDPAAVSAEQIDDPRFDENGPPAVLDPEGY